MTLVDKLGPGDSVRFSDGRVFKIIRKLGAGAETVILEVEDGFAIRVNKNRPGKMNYLVEFAEGWKVLSRYGVHSVEMDPENSLAGEYVAVEILRPAAGMAELMNYKEYLAARPHMQPEVRERFDEQFLEMVISTWAFQEIGDMYAEQILLTDRGFIVADFASEHKLAGSVSDGHLFAYGFAETFAATMAPREQGLRIEPSEKIPYPPGMRSRIVEALKKKRLEEGLHPGFCAAAKQVFRNIFSMSR